MSYIQKHIIETYAGLFDGLSPDSKIELIETLSKSLKKTSRTKERNFYKAFGAFASDKSPNNIMKEIRTARKFRKKLIQF
jgi:uncharacterized protein YjfI (DUF2170 family)